MLPPGRKTDLPWIGINRLTITLSQAQPLTAADITVNGTLGVNYGPVSVSGSGTSYTITLARPINKADRLTISIGASGIASFTGRLAVLPGDLNDDGVVNLQDLRLALKMWLEDGRKRVYGALDGDGRMGSGDFMRILERMGTRLPILRGGDPVPGIRRVLRQTSVPHAVHGR